MYRWRNNAGATGRFAPPRVFFGRANDRSAGLTRVRQRDSVTDMIRSGKWAVLVAMVASFPQPVTAAPLAPAGKWVVDFGAAQCVAMREYGTAEQPMTLILKAPAMGEVIQLLVARGGSGASGAEQVEGSVRFADAPRQTATALVYSPVKSKRRIVLYNLKRADVAGWPGEGVLTLQADATLRQQFELTDLKPLLKVLDECVTDLAAYWNYSEADAPPKLQRRATQARPLKALFSSHDYPEVNLWRNQEGRVGAILLINEQGRVEDCTLVETSGAAALDAQTCIILKNEARYTPAVGADGKPARDVDFARVHWRF
jgi:hypothetical protein